MSDGLTFPLPASVRLTGEGLVLREWTAADQPRMTELFDEPEIRHWTPLSSPFDEAAAQLYLERATERRRAGVALQLAITEGDAAPPLGEVLLFRRDGVAELGWALGAAHRGRRLASRAVRVLTDWAGPACGLHRFRALIEPGNTASEYVAKACGFAVVPGEPVVVDNRGRTASLTAWELTLPRAGAGAGRTGAGAGRTGAHVVGEGSGSG